MTTESENQEIQNKIRNIATELLNSKKVDVIIGYVNGTIPLDASIDFIWNSNQVNKLVWNNKCYLNLAKFLVSKEPQLQNPKDKKLNIGIITKGCIGRSLIQLYTENKIDFAQIKMIGINCNGIIDRNRIVKELGEVEILEINVIENDIVVKFMNLKGEELIKKFPFSEYLSRSCKNCKIKTPSSTNVPQSSCYGDFQNVSNVEDSFNDLNEFEKLNFNERFNYFEKMFKLCTNCYACREACPMCYCNLCFIDQNKPTWFGKTNNIYDIMAFHITRAIHLAGRCVDCGACSQSCPAGIDLNLITRKLQKIVKNRFGYTAGIDPKIKPPLTDFKLDDSEEFMLEE